MEVGDVLKITNLSKVGVGDMVFFPGLYILPHATPSPDNVITFIHHLRHPRVGVGHVVKMANLLEVEVGDVLRIKHT